MDEIFAAIVFLLCWRVAAAIVLAVLAALLLGMLAPMSLGPLVLTGLVLGAGLGASWQASAISQAWGGSNTTIGQQSLHPAIAFVGMAFIGVIWAGLLSIPLQSLAWAIAATALSPYLLAPLAGRLLSTRPRTQQLTLASVALATGPLLLVALNALAAKNAA